MKFNKLFQVFTDRTFVRFVLVGIVNTLFGTALMFACYNLLHLSYWISSAANYFFGSILSYFLNKYFTFQNRERDWRIIVRFTLNIIVCYAIAYGVAKPLVNWILHDFDFSIKIRENIAMFVGMCLFVALNYLGQRFFAFRKKNNHEE